MHKSLPKSNMIESWKHLSQTLRNRLKSFNQQSEEDFLLIGSQLQDFARRSQGLLETSSAIVSAMGQGDIVSTLQDLQNTLQKVKSSTRHLETNLTSSIKALDKALNKIQAIDDILLDFKKTFKRLNMLSFSTKIESTRLLHKHENFETLAGDVGKLAQLIASKFSRMRARAESLRTFISQGLDNMRHTVSDRHAQSQATLETMEQELNQLQQKQENATLISTDISNSLENINKSVNGVVVSLQFHDIIRQKIEHVCEALQEIQTGTGSELKTGLEPAGKSKEELQLWALQVLQLQSAQLKSTRSELTTALGNILCDLEAIGQNVGKISGEIQSLAGMTRTSSSTFLDQMEQRLASLANSLLANSLEENSRAASDMLNVMIKVAATVKDMSMFISDIEEIGTEIELIALNAQIKAARTGYEGRSLGVIAEAIQNLSFNTMAKARSVAKMFGEVSAIGQKLKNECQSDFKTMDTEFNTTINDVRKMLLAFQTFNQNIVEKLNHLNEISVKFAKDLQDTLSFIGDLDKYEMTLEQAFLQIDDTLETAKPALSQSRDGTLSIDFEQLASKYTMESERQVHQIQVGEPATAEPSSSDPGEDEDPLMESFDEENLGDNIEFF